MTDPSGPKFTVRPLSRQPRPDQKDSFRIYLSAASLLQTKLRAGDACRLQINANGTTPAVEAVAPKTAIAWSATEKIQDSVVQMSKAVQELYGFRLGDKVLITRTAEPLAEVDVARLEGCTPPPSSGPAAAAAAGGKDAIGEIPEADRAHWEWSLEYPLSRAEVIGVGMVFEHELKGCRRSFRVAEFLETGSRLNTNTIAQFGAASRTRIGGGGGGAAQQTDAETEKTTTTLKVDTAGLGGLDAQIRQINERLRDFSLQFRGLVLPAFYRSSDGILIHGPKGTGKSLLLAKLEASSWRKVFRMDSSVRSRAAGDDGEATLRKIFADALRYQPSVIAIDQLDFIAPKRGTGDTSSSSLVAALCESLDSLQDSQVLVAACARHPNDVDDSLRTPHRLGTEVELPVPTANGRKEILFALRGSDAEPSDRILEDTATRTHGYVGADLFSLLQLACRKALTRQLSTVAVDGRPTNASESNGHIEGDGVGQETEEQIRVRILEEDVAQALQETRPTAMREVFLETPTVKWTDIGGQHDIKRRLRKAVERPIKVLSYYILYCTFSMVWLTFYSTPTG